MIGLKLFNPIILLIAIPLVTSLEYPEIPFESTSDYLMHKDMYRKTCDDHEKRSGQFLLDYHLSNRGCTLHCIFLLSSSMKYQKYFDKSNITVNYFNNIRCGHRNVSIWTHRTRSLTSFTRSVLSEHVLQTPRTEWGAQLRHPNRPQSAM